MLYITSFFVLLLLAVVLPLGVLFILYIVLGLVIVKRWLYDLLILLLVLFFGGEWLNASNLVNQLLGVIANYGDYGFLKTLQIEAMGWRSITTNGALILLAIPLLVININNLLRYLNIKEQKQRDLGLDIAVSEHVTLGKTKGGIDVTLSDKELNQHCLIVGTTGSGKTTTILNFVESAVRRGLPVVYLDGKGSFDLVDKLSKVANHYGRVFKVFTLRPKSNVSNLAGYNPFSSGSATEWKNRIMSLFNQSENRGQEHFSLSEQNYINFIANILSKLGKPIDLRLFLAFLENPDKLIKLAYEVDAEVAQKIVKLHEGKEVAQLVGDILKMLELFIYSDYGHLFNTTSMDNVIKLKESITNGEIVLFMFDASAFAEDTNKVAKMVVNDLNSSFSDLSSFTKCYCIFDEFASYASSNLAETISLHRSNGIHAIIGTQSITTVKLKSPETKRVADELIACCNTYIVQTVNHSEDAELLAQVLGTRKSLEITAQIDSKAGGNTGLGSVKQVHEFKIHPQDLKDLRTGEAIVYRKVSGKSPVKTKINELKGY